MLITRDGRAHVCLDRRQRPQSAQVCLGLQPAVDPAQMAAALSAAGENGKTFPTDRFVAAWPIRKHDHFSITAGTVHCSGRDNLVLEISTTPYIFTFKLWDWERVGLDGRPRPDPLGAWARQFCCWRGRTTTTGTRTSRESTRAASDSATDFFRSTRIRTWLESAPRPTGSHRRP